MTQIHISIGHNCNPRIYLKNVLKYTYADGYKSCPFDLCITPFNSLYEAIKTDFEYFFDDLSVIPWGNAEGKRLHYDNPNAITNKYGIIFNHEGSGHSHLFNNGKYDDEYYTRNDFKEFKEKYLKRILNFKNYIKKFECITFVYNYDNNYIIDDNCIEKFKSLLYEKYPNNNFEFLNIDNK